MRRWPATAAALAALALAGCGDDRSAPDPAGSVERLGTATQPAPAPASESGASPDVPAPAGSAPAPKDRPEAEPPPEARLEAEGSPEARPEAEGSPEDPPELETLVEPEPAGAGSPRDAGASRAVSGHAAVQPLRRVALRATPGGAVAARVGPITEFGSPRWMPAVRRRGDWIAVIAPELGNGRLGWLPARAVTASHVDVRIDVDLSERRLVVRRDGRAVLRMPVGVGAPGTHTPTGRFAVTDGLQPPAGSPYGCCILALSGHQPNVPQGWTGGDRIAVHGTSAPSTVGTAASSGCLRAHDDDMRRLLAIAQLGAIVRIRA